jgi:hypothetical protein
VGKWVVTVDAASLDDSWHTICHARGRGELGLAAKSRTALPHPVFKSRWETLTCVYTRDSRRIKSSDRYSYFLGPAGESMTAMFLADRAPSPSP